MCKVRRSRYLIIEENTTVSYKIESQLFSLNCFDRDSCQLECDKDTQCTALIISETLCIGISSMDTGSVAVTNADLLLKGSELAWTTSTSTTAPELP